MKAAIYTRVSTEDQEREGTSLQSQKEACLKKASELGYKVPLDCQISEVYSGLTLDRPELIKLRTCAKNKEIAAVIAYSTDRLSRDPVHLLLLADEYERASIPLIFVTEPLDNSMEGQLLGFVRGWASKLEALKIAERGKRGRRTRAENGRLPANSHARLYGYTYIPGKGVGEGIRYINEKEAHWVREAFRWLVEEGLSTYAITMKLRALEAPFPSPNGRWNKSTVQRLLRNPAYFGKTYAFTMTYTEPKNPKKLNRKHRKTLAVMKPKDEWVEIPNATPPIISEELFEAAQKQLKKNKALARRNMKRDYLLHGHIRCVRCGRSYWSYVGTRRCAGNVHCYRRYRCSGKLSLVSPIHCDNKSYAADYLEGIVWQEIEKVLAKPEIILAEFQRRAAAAQDSFLQNDLERVESILKNRERQKDRAWKAFMLIGDEEKFKRETAIVYEEIKSLKSERQRLEDTLEEAKHFKLNIKKVSEACELVKENLGNLTFEDKRLALEALQIEVWIDGDEIAIKGAIPMLDEKIMTTQC